MKETHMGPLAERAIKTIVTTPRIRGDVNTQDFNLEFNQSVSLKRRAVRRSVTKEVRLNSASFDLSIRPHHEGDARTIMHRIDTTQGVTHTFTTGISPNETIHVKGTSSLKSFANRIFTRPFETVEQESLGQERLKQLLDTDGPQ